MIVSVFAVLLLSCLAASSAFAFEQKFVGGILITEEGRGVRVYKVNSKMEYRMLWIQETSKWYVTDVRWNGDKIVVNLAFNDNRKPQVRIYSDFGRYELVRM